MMIKGIVGLAALLAGGFVTIDRVVIERVKAASERISVVPQPASLDAGTYKVLREQANSALNGLQEREKALQLLERENATKRAKLALACRDQVWPYYSGDCVGAGNGPANPGTVRIIHIDNRTASLSPQRTSF